MHDFLGNVLVKGTYCAYPGRGNVDAEYGMILMKIIDIIPEKKKLKVVRVKLHFGQSEQNIFHPSHLKNAIISSYSDDYQVALQVVSSFIENTNRLVRVNPNKKVIDFFEKALALDKSCFEILTPEQIKFWLLGSTYTLENKNPFA